MASLWNKLSEVWVLVIDEICKVSNILFHQVHQRLTEIFGCESNAAFSRLPVLFCNDFHQLPPVRGLPIYANASSINSYPNLDLWRNFKLVELTEAMRQEGNSSFFSLLNKIMVNIK